MQKMEQKQVSQNRPQLEQKLINCAKKDRRQLVSTVFRTSTNCQRPRDRPPKTHQNSHKSETTNKDY
jgi:hypothetical protein